MLAHQYLIRPFTVALPVMAACLAAASPLPRTNTLVDVYGTEGKILALHCTSHADHLHIGRFRIAQIS